MKFQRWLCAGTLIFALSGFALADGHGHGRGHDRDDDDHGRHYYSDHDRDQMGHWYHDQDDRHLPPGLAKRDRLPPGLEKQLRVRGTLPPGLRRDMRPCPEEIVERLPPPPPHCAHMVIGGHIVLVNQSSYMVLDILHFER